MTNFFLIFPHFPVNLLCLFPHTLRCLSLQTPAAGLGTVSASIKKPKQHPEAIKLSTVTGILCSPLYHKSYKNLRGTRRHETMCKGKEMHFISCNIPVKYSVAMFLYGRINATYNISLGRHASLHSVSCSRLTSGLYGSNTELDSVLMEMH